MAEEKGVAPIQAISLERPNLLSSPQRKGFHRRWVRNTEEDVERMKEIGWDVAKKEGDSPITRRELILMQIPTELYAARQGAKVAKIHDFRRAHAARKAAATETDRLAGAPESKGLISTIGDVSISGGVSKPD